MKGILLVTDDSAFTGIAGLPVITRLLCAGRKGGILDWLILTTTQEEPCRRLVVEEPRLGALRCTVVHKEQLSQEAFVQWLGDAEAVILPCAAICDHRLLRHIIKSADPSLKTFVTREGRSTACVAGTAAALWPLLQSRGPCSIPDGTPTVSLREGLWAPLRLGHREIEQRLFASLGRDTDGFLARALDRKVSRLITRRLADTRITPNQITTFSFALGLLSAWLLMQPSYWPRVSGATLLLLSTTIDGCDGELARLKFLESDFGAKFDLLADNVVHLLLFPGIALGLYRETQLPVYMTLALVTLVGVLCSMAIAYIAIFRSPTGLTGSSGARTPLVEFYERLTGRDFAYILLALAVVDRLAWFLWAAAVGTYVFAGGLFLVFLVQKSKARDEG